jgi:hypothetical protein
MSVKQIIAVGVFAQPAGDYVNRGNMYSIQKDHGHAIRNCAEAPNIAAAYYAQNDKNKARADFESTIKSADPVLLRTLQYRKRIRAEKTKAGQ